MTANLRGSLWMMMAMLCFGLEDTFFKLATATVSPGVGTIYYGLSALALCVLVARRKGVRLWHPAFLRRALLIRTGFELLGRVFFALSLAFTPLSTTSAILQAAPLVVMLGAAIVLGEKIGPRRWAAMAVGFAGVLLIIRPSPSGVEPNAIFALLGMIGFAGRDLATRTSPPEVHSAQLGLLGFGVVTFAGILIVSFEATTPALPDPHAALLLSGTAICGVIGYTALTAAMRTGEVSVVAPFRYSRLIVALIIAVTVFGEQPDTLTLTGAALIMGSGIYSLWRDGKRRAEPLPRSV